MSAKVDAKRKNMNIEDIVKKYDSISTEERETLISGLNKMNLKEIQLLASLVVSSTPVNKKAELIHQKSCKIKRLEKLLTGGGLSQEEVDEIEAGIENLKKEISNLSA